MKDTVLALIHEYPELVYVLMLGVVWPIASGLANLGRAAFAHRYPRLAAALQASGFDPLGVVRSLAKAKGLPVPPADAAPPTPRTSGEP